MTMLRCISPIDGSVYAERPAMSLGEAKAAIARARDAQRDWAARPLSERVALVRAGVARLGQMNDVTVPELARMMGRPVRYGGEFGGVEERASYMADIAEEALAPLRIEDSQKFERWIARAPHGVILVIAPWNYPYLTAINSVAPGLIAGNAVILKHATQTLLAGERHGRGVHRRRRAGRRVPGGVPRPCDHRAADRRARVRLRKLHRIRRGRARDRAGGGRHLHGRRAGARRQGSGLCHGRCGPRCRRRHPDRRRHVQFRPVLLRDRAHLRGRALVRRLRREGGGDRRRATGWAIRSTRRRR